MCPVSPKFDAFRVFIDLVQISPIIFTRMRPLICHCKEFGLLTVGDVLQAVVPHVDLRFLQLCSDGLLSNNRSLP